MAAPTGALGALVAVLDAVMSPDRDVRKAAEQQLVALRYTRGHLVQLLQVVYAGEREMATRQIAAITLKNLCGAAWDSEGAEESGRAVLHEEDKTAVRSALLEALVQLPPNLRSQLQEVLSSVVYADFPERFPELLPAVQAGLGSGDGPRTRAALQALRVIARKYEFRTGDDEKGPMRDMMAATFPALLGLFRALLEQPSADVAIAEMLKLVCKVFWSASFLELPPMLRDPRGADTAMWLQCFLVAITKPVPTEGAPGADDPEGRAKWPWWKAKKWALHVAGRLHSRYGDPKVAPKDRKEFAEVFLAEWSPRFLEAHMQMLAPLRCPAGTLTPVDPNAWLPPRCVNLCMQFLQNCLNKKVTYELMRPHMQTLLLELAFPELCFNAEDAELWEEDPHEYVRKGYDIIEDMYSPRMAAMNLISEACSVRKKDAVGLILQFLAQAYQGCAQAVAAGDPAALPTVYRLKDGAMLLTGTISQLLKSKRHREHLRPLLQQYVLPEFSSPRGHLRSKAAYVVGKFADPKLLGDEIFTKCMQRIVERLTDHELPVRVDMVVALRPYVEEAELDMLRPVLPKLLNDLFGLISEVENEDLVLTLETIVERFGEEIAPFAQGLTTSLCGVFWRCMGEDDEDDNDDADFDDSGALAAMGCLRAIATILESLSSLPHLYATLEPTLVPMLDKLLTAEGQDVYEEALEITSYLTYFSPTISPALWSLWPRICSALTEWAVDYLENALVPMDNFISRGTETFLAPGAPYMAQLFAVARHVLVDAKVPDEDAAPAAKLLECVLLNCPGRVDEWVPHMVQVSITRLADARANFFKDQLMCVVAAAIYYNAPLALNVIASQQGSLAQIFTAWFGMIFETNKKMRATHFKKEFNKKLCALALVRLMALPAAQLPQEILAAEGQLLQGTLRLLVELKTQMAQRKLDEEAEESDEEADDDDEDEWDGGEQEDVEDDDGYLEKLAKQARSYQWKGGEDTHDADDDDDDDDYDAFFGTSGYDDDMSTPLDSVDAFATFKDVMVALQGADPARAQAMAAGLAPEAMTTVNELMAYAEVRRVEIVQEAQAKMKGGNATAATPHN